MSKKDSPSVSTASLLSTASGSSATIEEGRGQQPQIVYTTITRGKDVTLVEYIDDKEKKKLNEVKILPFSQHLPSLEKNQEWNSYGFSEEYAIHYIIDETTDLFFICMVHRSMRRRIALSYLCDVQDALKNFISEYRKRPAEFEYSKAKEYEFQSGPLDFKKKLKELTEKTKEQGYDNIANLHARVQDVKEVLDRTMTNLMVRQEAVNHLGRGVESLNQSATSFRRESSQLQRQMRWKNIKVIIYIVLIVLVALAVIVFFSCGFKLDKC